MPSRGVDVQTYFHGLGNLEVIRMIALSDQVFGWDTDYDVLFDASVEAIRADPGWYARGVAQTFWDFLSQRYAPEPRVRPVPIPELPTEFQIDGKPFPAPITVSPLVQAVRYGFVWCPTDDLDRCVVPHPAAALGSASEGRRYTELVDTIRDWNAQLPVRDSNTWLANKGGTAAVRWPRPILWIAVALVALGVAAPAGQRADPRADGRLRGRPARPCALPGAPERVRAALRARVDHRGPRRPPCAPQPARFHERRAPEHVTVCCKRTSRAGPARGGPGKQQSVTSRSSHRGVPRITAVPRLELIRQDVFADVADAGIDIDARLGLLADMCRFNALTAVKGAGSGHLGSTFSSLDVVAHLLWEHLNVAEVGFDSPDRDVFFSSKGHDVPGLYAALNALGVVPTERLLRLRRLGGLDGHPDVGVPGIEANSGSLGMGISKARGIAWAKRHLGRGGRVVVMTGDGELQEGQNWEALQAASHQRIGRLLVIVDRNELQSDRTTEEILALESLDAKLRAFGCRVETCDGHDHAALRASLGSLEAGDDGTPGVLVARTIKGKGVSFMEHPAALAAGGGTYRWHAGAPDDETFEAAAAELRRRIDDRAAAVGLGPIEPELVPEPGDELPASLQGEPESGAGAPATAAPALRDTAEYVAAAYGEALLGLAAREPRLVVLDADLASDCRVRAFELAEPDRFVENGIAEQDMVSMAAGMARHGLIPVVNSFASFLASRANEQIYNQASERTKVVYAMHYAGLIPAGPGKSHQSLRDASLVAAIPGVSVVHPCNGVETAALLEWAVLEASESVAIRLAIGPSPGRIELPAGYRPTPGVGLSLREGTDALIVSYGPVLVHEALVAAETLARDGVEAGVVAMPWLDRVDPAWLAATFDGARHVLVVEDHAPVGALGDTLRRALTTLPDPPTLDVAGVEGWPACGTPTEALAHHRLDGASLAARVARMLARTTV